MAFGALLIAIILDSLKYIPGVSMAIYLPVQHDMSPVSIHVVEYKSGVGNYQTGFLAVFAQFFL